ncbi:hypothetical protein EB796_005104 [Bugula neritina]|uniref:Uncharacterized protein n=1 Tax=Bugula neritina TaxID=10212 RepID=A0A7J7KD28_BUGNE|nr:hypothetical protein EB796_005104 [Bugula neritina]
MNSTPECSHQIMKLAQPSQSVCQHVHLQSANYLARVFNLSQLPRNSSCNIQITNNQLECTLYMNRFTDFANTLVC